MRNIRSVEQFLRLALAVIALLAGFYWLAGTGQWVAYGVGALLLINGAGLCVTYGFPEIAW